MESYQKMQNNGGEVVSSDDGSSPSPEEILRLLENKERKRKSLFNILKRTFIKDI